MTTPYQTSKAVGPQGYLEDDAKKALLARLARIEGHVRAVSRMVDERDWADEILLQVAAVKGGLNRFASTLVEDELKACLSHCKDPNEQEERIDRLTKVLSTLFKQS
ncbi:MAG: metal-sensitive transcriptional regulator [Gemmatimonadota bacterium]|nr:MAG: metal-sensitive transcriptional regulator [Gemmatimonadota bacterium]